MDPRILFNNLAALLLSLAVLIAAYRLLKTYPRPFLSDYTVFLLLSAVWGFALWTIPGFLEASKTASGAVAPWHKLPLLSKWFGFPFHLLQLYFLALTLAGLLEVPVKRSFKRIYAVTAGVVLIILFSALLKMLGGGPKNVFNLLHKLITDAYLIVQAALFLWAGWGALRIDDPGRRRTAGLFAWLYLAGFAVYFSGSTWINWRLGPWLMSAYHLPSLIILALALRRGRLKAAPPDAAPAAAAEEFLARFDLTKREHDIVGCLLAGRSNREIAKDLFLSHQTVKNYVSRIYKKIGVTTRLELMNAVPRAGSGPEIRP
jgi:DNA-binding CsgD family transcriptional regulator